MSNTRLLKTGIVREGTEEILMLRDDGYRIWVNWYQGKPNGEDYDGEHLWAEYKQCDFPRFSKLITDLLMNDPTTELQHSLMQALNECDELREKNKEQERIIQALTEANRNHLAAYPYDDDLDEYKQAIVLVLQRITTALGLNWICTDYDPEDYEKRVLAAIKELQPKDSKLGTDLIDEMNTTAQLDDRIRHLEAENEVYKKAIDAMSPNFKNADKIQELEEIIQRDRSNADRAIQAKDQEIDRLREALDIVNSDAKVQIEGRDAALRGSTIEYKKLNQKIEILQENLTRSDSDRLSELTSIMRMLQAWESVPIQKWGGALYLIKRVLFEAICKLDPSQAVEL